MAAIFSRNIELESGREYDFRSCTCGTERKPRLNRDFRVGFTVHCPACGLTTLPEMRERDAVCSWDDGDVRELSRKG